MTVQGSYIALFQTSSGRDESANIGPPARDLHFCDGSAHQMLMELFGYLSHEHHRTAQQTKSLQPRQLISAARAR